MDPKIICKLDLKDYPCGLSWSKNATTLASGSYSGLIGVANLNSLEPIYWEAHPGGVLDLDWTEKGEIVSVGQDGQLCWWTSEGVRIRSQSLGSAWAEHVTCCIDDIVATSSGKHLSFWNRVGEQIGKTLVMPSTISDIALNSEGNIIVVSHYGGVSFVDPRDTDDIHTLKWKGSIISLSWGPMNRWLIAGSQEQSVLGFDLKEGKNCQMDGFSGKVESQAWDSTGDWVALSGGSEILFWPFDGEGPIDRDPIVGSDLENETDSSKWTSLSFHPYDQILVAGNENGDIELFFDLSQNIETLTTFKFHKLSHAVVGVQWHPSGEFIAFADSFGEIELLESFIS